MIGVDEASLPGVQTAASSLCPRMAFPQYARVEIDRDRAPHSSPYKATSATGVGPTLMTLFNRNCFLKAQIQSHWGLWIH